MSSRRRRRGGNSLLARLQDLVLAPFRFVGGLYQATIGRLFRRRRRRSESRRNVFAAFFQTLSEIIAAPFVFTFRLLWFIVFDWATSRQARPILLGLPALIVAGGVIAAIVYANQRPDERIAAIYARRAQQIIRSNSEGELTVDALAEVSDSADEEDDTAAGIRVEESFADNDEALRTAALYLEKAVKLDADREEYKFFLASVRFELGDRNAAFSLMNQVAPLPRTGESFTPYNRVTYVNFDLPPDLDNFDLQRRVRYYAWWGEAVLEPPQEAEEDKTGQEDRGQNNSGDGDSGAGDGGTGDGGDGDGGAETGTESLDSLPTAGNVASGALPQEGLAADPATEADSSELAIDEPTAGLEEAADAEEEATPEEVSPEDLTLARLCLKSAYVLNQQLPLELQNPAIATKYAQVLLQAAVRVGDSLEVAAAEIEQVMGDRQPENSISAYQLAMINVGVVQRFAVEIAKQQRLLAGLQDPDAKRAPQQRIAQLTTQRERYLQRAQQLADQAVKMHRALCSQNPQDPRLWLLLVRFRTFAQGLSGERNFEAILAELRGSAYSNLTEEQRQAFLIQVESQLLLGMARRDLGRIDELQQEIAQAQARLTGANQVSIDQQDAIEMQIAELEQNAEELRGQVVGLITEILKRIPQNQTALSMVGTLYRRPDFANSEAVRQMVASIAGSSGTPAAHFIAGNFAAQEKRWEAAQYHFEQAYKIFKKVEEADALNNAMTPVLNNLAFVLINNPVEEGQQGRYEEALAYINEAIELDQQATYYDTRGRVLMKLKRWRDALDDFERAKPAMRAKPEFHENMATCFDKIGIDSLRDLHREEASRLKAAQEGS